MKWWGWFLIGGLAGLALWLEQARAQQMAQPISPELRRIYAAQSARIAREMKHDRDQLQPHIEQRYLH